jgi:type IV secretion system protein VirB5
MPSDAVLARSNLENSYNFLTQRGASILNGIFTQNNPVSEFGKKTRSLHVDTVLPISKDTFQAEWSEIEYDMTGIRTSMQVLHGVFTVLYQEPNTEETVRKNPLGIYIDNFSWSVSMK